MKKTSAPTTLKVSFAQLVICSPQEIVLQHRHGMTPEHVENDFAVRQGWYRGVQHYSERQVSFEFAAECGNLKAEVSFRRFYHHDGCLYRIAPLDQSGAKVRTRGPKQREVNMLALAGALVARRFSTAPKELRYQFDHLGATEDEGIVKTEFWTVKAASDEELTAFLTEKFIAIEKALALPDEALPACDTEQQYLIGGDRPSCLSADEPRVYRELPPAPQVFGTPTKCLNWCPVRHQCRQRAEYLRKNEEILTGANLH